MSFHERCFWLLCSLWCIYARAEDDIRETAYEILVAVSGNNPNTFRSLSMSTSMKQEIKPQTSKSITSSAASQMKRAFGLQSSGGSTEILRSSSFKSKKNTTISDVLRAQMRISENSETRTRRALSRASAGQVHFFSNDIKHSSIYSCFLNAWTECLLSAACFDLFERLGYSPLAVWAAAYSY